MNTTLIISAISLVLALALIGYVNYKSRKTKTPEIGGIKIPIKTTYSMMEIIIGDLVNDHRESIKLNRLILHNTISTVAQEHSINLAKLLSKKHEYAYIRKLKLKNAIDCTEVAEIVAKGQGTAEGIFRMWLKSPSHRKKIEDKRWTHFGFSIEQSILKRNYTTLIFTK